MRPGAAIVIIAATLAALCTPGCSPLSVTFTLGARPERLNETTVIEAEQRGSLFGGGTDKVVMIDVRGLIVDAPRPGLFSAGTNPVDDLVARLQKAEQDAGVKAVVLRINSPGGSVTASDTMYREVRRFADRTGKPVVASLGEVSASGAYYLALAADEIVSQPTTIAGSIGVIIPTVNVSEGLRRIGIAARSVKSGPNKDLANPLEPIREGQYEVLQALVDEYYERFRSLVVQRRPAIRSDRLAELTDGRVVTGTVAVTTGLADREGDLRDAFDAAKRLAGLTDARLVKYHGETERPRTAYAATSAADPLARRAGAAGTEINLLQIDLGQGGLGGPLGPGAAYYLWTAELP